MKTRRSRLAFSLALSALMLGGLFLFATPEPAVAQCLSQSECDDLRARLGALRDESRPDREAARALIEQMRDLPRGSDERRELKRQLRELRRDGKERRQEARALKRQYRSGCREC